MESISRMVKRISNLNVAGQFGPDSDKTPDYSPIGSKPRQKVSQKFFDQAQEVNQEDDREKFFVQTKVVLLGESGVGKSSILGRFAFNSFSKNCPPTVSPHFVSKLQTIYKMGAYQVQFDIWDTAGQEKYRCLTQMYFRNANIALIVYDVTSRTTLDCVDYWVDEVMKAQADNFFVILVGNKSDLEVKRQVSIEEGQAKADEIKAVLYYETSANDQKSVERLFQEIGCAIFKRRDEEEIPDVTLIILTMAIIGNNCISEYRRDSKVNDVQAPQNLPSFSLLRCSSQLQNRYQDRVAATRFIQVLYLNAMEL